MLGFGDFWVLFAYAANIIVVIICVVYGIVNWNRGGENSLVEEKDGE
ncbi:MAG: hypothetical protein IKB71_04085 [Lentisphaeria bacterium]|nr:hypothetical protein [Lentisphaeria bacterium]